MIKALRATVVAALLCLCAQVSAGELFRPHLSLCAGAGALRSFFKSEGQMKAFMEPTSDVLRVTAPALGAGLDLMLGNYLGIETGLGYMRMGQSTEKTTVTLMDDPYRHDFESHVYLDYITVPLLLKGGVRKGFFSLFLRFGIQPSIMTGEDVEWIIDGNSLKHGGTRMPDVTMSSWIVPLRFGGEIGFHLRKNGLFLVGDYIYGFSDMGNGVNGDLFCRAYGASLQYRRELF